MKISATLSRYLAKSYIINVLVLFSALLAVVYLFDTVELIRRAAKSDDIPLSLVLQMGLLKLPEVGQLLFPFGILFGAMVTFWQLTRRHELIVMRAAGFSVWQFLTPVIVVTLAIGFLQMMIINPIGALLVGKYEQLENTYLKHQSDEIAIFQEGLWLRQKSDLSEAGYVILHARRIEPPWTLSQVTVFYFNAADEYVQRMNAKTATLEPGRWLFRDTVFYAQQGNDVEQPIYAMATHLTAEDVEESFSSPETMSFWHLPAHIKTLEDTGFDAHRLRVHYQNLLAQPLLFVAMVLLAASVSMRQPRSRGTLILISSGVFIGFIVFFMSSFLQALGASQQIPVILAAWSPALISLFLGLSVMMSLEDG